MKQVMHLLQSNKLKLYIASKLFHPNYNQKFGYKKITDNKQFSVYKRFIGGKKIEAANGTVVVTSKANKYTIYPDYRYSMVNKSFRLNNKYLPNLLEGSSFSYCLVLPYMRKVTVDRFEKSWRVVVVTDRGQIYHNFPANKTDCDGEFRECDMCNFEESVIWDLPGNKYPSQNINCSEHERYFPGLPDECYEYFPKVDEKSKFGNVGFHSTFYENGEVLPRFYIARREPAGNPFFYMQGISITDKMTVLGTYNSNVDVGVRTCIFVSDDGGRQWFCKYEFGDLGEYKFQQGKKKWGYNFGNPIEIKQDELGSKITLRKRNCIVPSKEDKEPQKKFYWDDNREFTVEHVDNVFMLKSRTPHMYQTGNIVSVISDDCNKWRVNKGINETSVGNGLLFKVEVIDELCIKLHEFVASASNPISCRHIHHINRVRDGWIVGTGEIYPNSWILYMQMLEADTFSEKNAREHFNVFRLNSSQESVQRTMGVVWNDIDDSIVYASDHDILTDKYKKSPFQDRDLHYIRNATGIYGGKLQNIDDYNSFSILYEAEEPAFLFDKFNNVFVFSGQRGEIAMSSDNGKTWRSEQIDGPLNHYRGRTYHYYIFDDYLLKIK